jgi:hypothetical protein
LFFDIVQHNPFDHLVIAAVCFLNDPFPQTNRFQIGRPQLQGPVEFIEGSLRIAAAE